MSFHFGPAYLIQIRFLFTLRGSLFCWLIEHLAHRPFLDTPCVLWIRSCPSIRSCMFACPVRQVLMIPLAIGFLCFFVWRVYRDVLSDKSDFGGTISMSTFGQNGSEKGLKGSFRPFSRVSHYGGGGKGGDPLLSQSRTYSQGGPPLAPPRQCPCRKNFPKAPFQISVPPFKIRRPPSEMDLFLCDFLEFR